MAATCNWFQKGVPSTNSCKTNWVKIIFLIGLVGVAALIIGLILSFSAGSVTVLTDLFHWPPESFNDYIIMIGFFTGSGSLVFLGIVGNALKNR